MAWHAETTDGGAKPQQQITNNENSLRWRGRGQSSVMRSEMQSLVSLNSKFCSPFHSINCHIHSNSQSFYNLHYSFWWHTEKSYITSKYSSGLYNIHGHGISHQLSSYWYHIYWKPILVIYLTALSKATHRNGQFPWNILWLRALNFKGTMVVHGTPILQSLDLQPSSYKPWALTVTPHHPITYTK